MKNLSILINLNLFILIFSAAMAKPTFANSQVRCEAYFSKNLDSISSSLLAFQGGAQDTTTLREERKYVIKSNSLDHEIQRLQNQFDKKMTNRDIAAPGTKNLTSTIYLPIVKFTDGKKTLSAKIRARKYKVKYANGEIETIPELQKISWLELKIQHPDYENTVIKPRLKALDADIQLMVSDVFESNRLALFNRLLRMNPGKSEDIKKFLNFFSNYNKTTKKKNRKPFALTVYERTSYSIKLKNIKTGAPVDIQITLDKNVELTRLTDHAEFNAYNNDETVVEVKIPVQYSKLNQNDFGSVPGLAEIAQSLNWFHQNHESQYPMHRGKMSKIEKPLQDYDDHD